MQQAEIIKRVNKVLQEELDVPESSILQESHIMNDLGIMPDNDIDKIHKVKDIVKVVGDLLER